MLQVIIKKTKKEELKRVDKNGKEKRTLMLYKIKNKTSVGEKETNIKQDRNQIQPNE